MKDRILRIFDFFSARKAPAATTVAAITAVCALVIIFRVNFQENIAAFFPKDEATAKYEQIYEKTGTGDKIAVIFSGDAADAAEAKEIFSTFHPLDEEADPMEVFSFIMDNAPYFVTEEDLLRLDSLISRDGYISEKMRQNRESLWNPSTEYSTQYLRNDPLGLLEPMLQRLKALNPLLDSNIQIGFVTSPYGGNESGMNARLSEALQQAKDSTLAACPDVEIYITGSPVVAAANATRIKKDTTLALCIAIVLIGLLLFLSFRRFSDVLWIAVTILFSSIFAVAVAGLCNPNLSVILLGIGTMVIGIAVNYPLHYADHLKHQSDRRSALKDIIEPLLVGNITTVGAFLTLTCLNSEAIRDFGVLGAAMLIGTIVFVLVFLPVFLPVPGPRKTIRLDFDRSFNPGPKTRRAATIIFILATAFVGWHGTQITFDSDLNNINYETSEQRKGFEILSSLGSIPDSSQTVYIAKESSNADEVLGGFDFLPSKQEQARRLADWTGFWENHTPELRIMKAEAAKAGFRPDAFEPFLNKVGTLFDVKDIDYFQPIASSIAKGSFFKGDSTYTSLKTLTVKDTESEAVKARLKADLPEGTIVFSAADLGNSLGRMMNEDFNDIGWICSLIVFFFLWLSFGRIELSLVSFLPLAIGWVWILGIMHLTGQQFNLVNIILATFIFGQGDDYTIFITEGLMYEYATGRKILSSYKNGIILSALIMFAGIGALIVAKHPAMHSLATVTMTGMVTVVAMACLIPPAVFRFFTMKRGQKRARPLTFSDILRTVYMMTVFVLAMIIMTPVTLIVRNKEHLHRILYILARIAINGIPGIRFTVRKEDDLKKPALYICNHQSHLDVLAIMSVNPKLAILTNDWAWNNIFYGRLIRHAQFFRANGIEQHIDDLRELVGKGYSILVYPEGTRSENSQILRFHRGAFVLARELGLDILPLCIHGFGDVMPKNDHIVHSSDIFLHIGRRESLPEGDIVEITRNYRHRYIEFYASLRKELETPAYNRNLVRAKYLYKGRDAEKQASRTLNAKALAAARLRPESGRYVIEEAGYGAFALLYALSNRDIEVDAYISDEEKYLVATGCAGLPENLHYHLRQKNIP